MAKRLLSYSEENIRQAEEVAEILEQHNIEYYETPSSRWGFSKASIWIRNDADFEQAKVLFEQNIQDFARRARQAYQEETGYNPDAPLEEKTRFYVNFLKQRKAAIPVVILGIGLIAAFYYFFFALFLG